MVLNRHFAIIDAETLMAVDVLNLRKEGSKLDTNPRTVIQIEERIARLALRWHYEDDDAERARLLGACQALYWAANPGIGWRDCEDQADGYMMDVLAQEEGLSQ